MNSLPQFIALILEQEELSNKLQTLKSIHGQALLSSLLKLLCMQHQDLSES